MNICFVWTREFKNLINFGVSFSNKYDFRYESSDRTLTRLIKDPMPMLFGTNITSITGVLGLNGSGKTNTLELICRVLKSPEKLKNEYLLVYCVDGNFFFKSNIKEGFTSNTEIVRAPDDDLEEFHTVYFSNVYDKNFIDLGDGVIDVSTNNKNNPRTLALQKEIRESEFLSELEFLRSKEFEKIDIPLPKRVEVKIDRFLTRHEQTSDHDSAKPILNYFSEVRKYHRSKCKIHLAALTIQMGFLKTLLAYKLHDDDFLNFVTSKIPNNKYYEFDEFIENLRKYYSQNLENTPWNKNFLISETLLVLSNLVSFFENRNFSMDNTLKGSRFTFTIDYSESDDFYYRHLACAFQGVRFSSLAWAGISSGQRAYTNLFSSIWNGIQHPQSKNVNPKGTLICIDEGDLYLHPQWQIEFIDRLIKSLPKISGGKVQIIITTHSPILISDLPHQCIVLLNSEKLHPTTSLVIETIPPKTFAANLYDIYESSFGLQQQRSGKLSARYLEQTFRLLDKESLTPEDIDSLQLAMSVIDDEIVKFHIQRRVNRN